MPDEAREQTPEGATAFVTYYVALLNNARQRLDPSYVRELSSDCDSCNTLIDGLQGYATLGYRVEAGTISLDGVSEPLINEQGADFSVALSQEASSVYAADGTLIKSTTSSTFPASGALAVWDSLRSSWIMRELTIQ
jgi:hypothetical protein